MKLSTACKKAAAIIDRPGKWQKGAYGFGYHTGDTGCYCMIGAVAKALGENPTSVKLNITTYTDLMVPGFNDARSTTQDDAVLGLLVIGEFLKAEGL